MRVVDTIRGWLTGEPKDPAAKAAWVMERAEARQRRLDRKARALADRPDYQPPK